jgi:D-glycero-D-manno-heptose 1,7-bisphosphate phosphatase
MPTRRPGIIVDRDGTLIALLREETSGLLSVAFHPDHLRLLPGVVAGLRALSAAGYVLCIATNQPGPAKGEFSRDAVERTHAALLSLLAGEGVPIASLHACLHHPTGGPGGDPALVGPCSCRKPEPGLLLAALKSAQLDPAQTWMVGDSPTDIQAAERAGLRSALVFSTGRCELCPLRGGPGVAPDITGADFLSVAEAILKQRRPG